mmetsp:Transcript_746/g.2074  ORF Transcript_746/g.2074 Transcript_746/m.2074 type:complete len:323 (-) Transcript_746:648-1616(-)
MILIHVSVVVKDSAGVVGPRQEFVVEPHVFKIMNGRGHNASHPVKQHISVRTTSDEGVADTAQIHQRVHHVHHTCCMLPVVIRHITIPLLYPCEKSTDLCSVKVKVVNETHVIEYPHAQHTQRLSLRELRQHSNVHLPEALASLEKMSEGDAFYLVRIGDALHIDTLGQCFLIQVLRVRILHALHIELLVHALEKCLIKKLFQCHRGFFRLLRTFVAVKVQEVVFLARRSVLSLQKPTVCNRSRSLTGEDLEELQVIGCETLGHVMLSQVFVYELRHTDHTILASLQWHTQDAARCEPCPYVHRPVEAFVAVCVANDHWLAG